MFSRCRKGTLTQARSCRKPIVSPTSEEMGHPSTRKPRAEQDWGHPPASRFFPVFWARRVPDFALTMRTQVAGRIGLRLESREHELVLGLPAAGQKVISKDENSPVAWVSVTETSSICERIRASIACWNSLGCGECPSITSSTVRSGRFLTKPTAW